MQQLSLKGSPKTNLFSVNKTNTSRKYVVHSHAKEMKQSKLQYYHSLKFCIYTTLWWVSNTRQLSWVVSKACMYKDVSEEKTTLQLKQFRTRNLTTLKRTTRFQNDFDTFLKRFNIPDDLTINLTCALCHTLMRCSVFYLLL